MEYLQLIGGVLLLFAGGEWLVKGAVNVGLHLRWSTLVIGMTVVSLATSAPELVVSIFAAMEGHPDIALGNVIGSNIANIGLVLGLVASVFTLSVSLLSYRVNWPGMILFTLLFMALLWDGALVFWDGLALFLGLIAFNIWLILRARSDVYKVEQDDTDAVAKPLYLGLIWLVLGAVVLVFGSRFLVDGASSIAQSFGVSDRIISISIVAVGTSLPELAASFVAAFRGERDLSIGNLLGSNIFNVGAVLGLSSMIHPIQVDDMNILRVDIWWMLAFALLIFGLMRVGNRFVISKLQGSVLLVLYLVYLWVVFF